MTKLLPGESFPQQFSIALATEITVILEMLSSILVTMYHDRAVVTDVGIGRSYSNPLGGS